MAAIEALDVVDLVKSTLRDLGRGTFQQVAQDVVDYPVFTSWFKKDKVMFDDGIGIQRTLMARLPDVAKHVGWADEDTASIEDIMEQLQVPWRHAETRWSFKYQETLMNKGKSLIFNVIKPRRAGAMIKLAQICDNGAWAVPTSESDKTQPWGVPYWVPIVSGDPGFNGGLPGSYATIAGLTQTEVPTFKSYSGTYVSVTKPDLIKKMRTMKRATGFKSPIDLADYRKGKGERYRVYTNENVLSSFEEIGESQNENLGRDLASIDGVNMTFRGNPIVYTPQLDSNTADPVYFLDHSTFYPACLVGDYMREDGPIRDPKKRDWYTTYVNLSYNYLCLDRRRNGVLSLT